MFRESVSIPGREAIGMPEDLQAEANRLLNPASSPPTAFQFQVSPPSSVDGANQTDCQPTRRGSVSVPDVSHESTHFNVMSQLNRPGRTAATSFAPAAPGAATSRMHHKVPVPGEIPWRAFYHGTLVIICVWISATGWALYHTVFGWKISTTEQPETVGVAESEPQILSRVHPAVLHAACIGDSAVPVFAMKHASHAQVLVTGRIGARASRLRVRDYGCTFHRPVVDTSVVCRRRGDLEAGRCVVLFLRRGGRTLSVCRLAQLRDGSSMLRSVASLRLPPGAESLMRIAGAYSATSRTKDTGDSGAALYFAGLRVFGRTRDSGRLLALSPSSFRPKVSTATLTMASCHGFLRPDFEIDRTSPSSALQSDQANSEGEHLFAVGTMVLSLSLDAGPVEGVTCSVVNRNRDGFCRSTGMAEGALQLRTWNVSNGERMLYRMPTWKPWLQDSAAVVRQLCSLKPSSADLR